jgi:hypothetical protein
MPQMEDGLLVSRGVEDGQPRRSVNGKSAGAGRPLAVYQACLVADETLPQRQGPLLRTHPASYTRDLYRANLAKLVDDDRRLGRGLTAVLPRPHENGGQHKPGDRGTDLQADHDPCLGLFPAQHEVWECRRKD